MIVRRRGRTRSAQYAWLITGPLAMHDTVVDLSASQRAREASVHKRHPNGAFWAEPQEKPSITKSFLGHYLGARMLFNDGMTAVLTFGGIYAAGTFHWDALTMTMYGLELSVFAVLGGFFAGWLDNTLGSKKALFVSIGGTLIFFSLSLTFAPDRIFWVIPYDTTQPPINALPFFNTWPQVIFLMIVNGVAVFITAGYANARTMMARLAPPEKMTEFFGLMSLSGTSTTFLANVSVTFMTAYTASQRGGMLAIPFFLIAGLIWLAFVVEKRAVAV